MEGDTVESRDAGCPGAVVLRRGGVMDVIRALITAGSKVVVFGVVVFEIICNDVERGMRVDPVTDAVTKVRACVPDLRTDGEGVPYPLDPVFDVEFPTDSRRGKL